MAAKTKTTDVNEIVARCRRVGWAVETGSGTAWLYRITCADGTRVQIHSSPSDRNWKASVLRQLNAGGLAEAEKEWRRNDEARRKRAADAAAAKAATATKRAEQRAAAVARAAGDQGIAVVDAAWVLTPSRVEQTRRALMTPEVARKILDTINTGNRREISTNVRFFADLIRGGDWAETHQGMAVDWNGVLQDGQHRLLAIVETGETLPIKVTIGTDPANFGKIDGGALRSARDMARLRGETNVTALTVAARTLLALDDYGPDAHLSGHKARYAIDRVARKIDECGDALRDATKWACRIRREIGINTAASTVAIYRIGSKLPEGDPRVLEFFTQLETGVGVPGGAAMRTTDPVWQLRRMMIRHRDNRTTRLHQYEVLAYIIKTWNRYAAGKPAAGNLSWRKDEKFPEVFIPAPLEPAPDDAS